MTDINTVNLRLIDASILLVFLGVMRHRKATLVARDMGLTQPAVSHALKRLRAIYDDPLFLRKSHGLEPTALARELEPKVRRIVRMIGETLSEPEEFDPVSSEISLRIAAFDYELATLLPQFITRLIALNRNIRISALPLSGNRALTALADGSIDLAIGYFEPPPEQRTTSPFIAEELYSENYVATARRGHPLFSQKVTLRAFSKADHLLISPKGMVKGMVDFALNAAGLQRNVQTTVPSLFPALNILQRSELVAALPTRVVEQYAEQFDLDFAPLEIDGGTFLIKAVRHRRDADSSVHKWLTTFLRSGNLAAIGS